MWNNAWNVKHYSATVIDTEGYRSNVGIIVSSPEGRLIWCKRAGQEAWQFPQGGIRRHESPEQAMFRELQEETGLCAEHVQIMGRTRSWLRYRLPNYLIRKNQTTRCIGQKQLWYLLRLVGDEGCVKLDYSHRPEFDSWCWVDYWRPAQEVVFFKRNVYQRALRELAPLMFPPPSGVTRLPID